MSFHPIVPSGVYDSEELAMLKGLFDIVTGYEWFCKSVDSRERFAACVFSIYERGLHDPNELRIRCISTACARFSGSETQTDHVSQFQADLWRDDPKFTLRRWDGNQMDLQSC